MLFRSDSGGGFLISDARTGQAIGSSRYFGFDAAASEVEIGWTFLTRPYWGGPANAELKRLMLDHAFQFVTRVIFIVGVTNYRSQRAMEKIGGVRAGMRHQDGRDSVIYEIRR